MMRMIQTTSSRPARGRFRPAPSKPTLASSVHAGGQRGDRAAAPGPGRARGRGGRAQPGRHEVDGEPRARTARGARRVPHGLRARSRPDHSLQGVPAAQAQDPGLPEPRGRPLRDAPDAHDAGHPGGTLAGVGAEPERAAGGGHRARPRRRALPVRAHGRGGSVAVLPAGRLAPRRPERPDLGGDRGREPDLGGARRDPRHSWKITPPPATPEAFCVRFADRIAYLAHDALDALGRRPPPDAFPPSVIERFGQPGREWIAAR